MNLVQFIISFYTTLLKLVTNTNIPLHSGFPLDGSCPPLTVEEHRFSEILDRPLEITGTSWGHTAAL